MKGSRKVKQRICEDCTTYFQAQQLLASPHNFKSKKVETINDDDEIFSDDENIPVSNKSQVNSSPKRSPLNDISSQNGNCHTPSESITQKVGNMSVLKSALKVQSTIKSTEIKDEKLDLNSWTHSHTPPINSPYTLSPNISGMTPKTANTQPLPSETKINRIGTPESMIGSPVALSPENTNIYTDEVTIRPRVHIDTFRIMMISMLIVVLASTSMIVPKSSVNFRNNISSSKLDEGHYIITQVHEFDEITYDIPATYTGDFSLSDPVHNRNQVSLFVSNISKIFRSFFEQILGIRNSIISSIDNIKQKVTNKLTHELRSFTKVF